MFIIRSRSGRYEEILILHPFSKAGGKTSIAHFSGTCFAMDQSYIELKRWAMPSNVLPLHFAPRQANSS